MFKALTWVGDPENSTPDPGGTYIQWDAGGSLRSFSVTDSSTFVFVVRHSKRTVRMLFPCEAEEQILNNSFDFLCFVSTPFGLAKSFLDMNGWSQEIQSDDSTPGGCIKAMLFQLGIPVPIDNLTSLRSLGKGVRSRLSVINPTLLIMLSPYTGHSHVTLFNGDVEFVSPENEMAIVKWKTLCQKPELLWLYSRTLYSGFYGSMVYPPLWEEPMAHITKGEYDACVNERFSRNTILYSSPATPLGSQVRDHRYVLCDCPMTDEGVFHHERCHNKRFFRVVEDDIMPRVRNRKGAYVYKGPSRHKRHGQIVRRSQNKPGFTAEVVHPADVSYVEVTPPSIDQPRPEWLKVKTRLDRAEYDARAKYMARMRNSNFVPDLSVRKEHFENLFKRAREHKAKMEFNPLPGLIDRERKRIEREKRLVPFDWSSYGTVSSDSNWSTIGFEGEDDSDEELAHLRQEAYSVGDVESEPDPNIHEVTSLPECERFVYHTFIPSNPVFIHDDVTRFLLPTHPVSPFVNNFNGELPDPSSKQDRGADPFGFVLIRRQYSREWIPQDYEEWSFPKRPPKHIRLFAKEIEDSYSKMLVSPSQEWSFSGFSIGTLEFISLPQRARAKYLELLPLFVEQNKDYNVVCDIPQVEHRLQRKFDIWDWENKMTAALPGSLPPNPLQAVLEHKVRPIVKEVIEVAPPAFDGISEDEWNLVVMTVRQFYPGGRTRKFSAEDYLLKFEECMMGIVPDLHDIPTEDMNSVIQSRLDADPTAPLPSSMGMDLNGSPIDVDFSVVETSYADGTVVRVEPKCQAGCFIYNTLIGPTLIENEYYENMLIFVHVFIEICFSANILELSNVRLERSGEGLLHFAYDPGCILNVKDLLEFGEFEMIGLTTLMVLGTIGDIEPSLDVVSSTYIDALTLETSHDSCMIEDHEYLLDEDPSGCLIFSDLISYDRELSSFIYEKLGKKRFFLGLKGEYLRRKRICFTGTLEPAVAIINLETTGEMINYRDYEFENLYMVNLAGDNIRQFPKDLVIVTHGDHFNFVNKVAPGVEIVPLSVDCKPFIKLGQDIMEIPYGILSLINQMNGELQKCFTQSMQPILSSDVVYLNSGAVFSSLIAGLFWDKRVFEICPVPRENNGICPEFYIAHLAGIISTNPTFSHLVGNMWNERMFSRMRKGFKQRYVPRKALKIHSVTDLAYERYGLSTPNVGFKPYTKFVPHIPRDCSDGFLSIYISFGSCEKLNKEAEEVLDWVARLGARVDVDERWFSSCKFPATPLPFIDHSKSLASYDLVINHGGSGVVNTCLKVEVPQMVVPQVGDQFVWRDFLEDIGLQIHMSDYGTLCRKLSLPQKADVPMPVLRLIAKSTTGGFSGFENLARARKYIDCHSRQVDLQPIDFETFTFPGHYEGELKFLDNFSHFPGFEAVHPQILHCEACDCVQNDIVVGEYLGLFYFVINGSEPNLRLIRKFHSWQPPKVVLPFEVAQGNPAMMTLPGHWHGHLNNFGTKMVIPRNTLLNQEWYYSQVRWAFKSRHGTDLIKVDCDWQKFSEPCSVCQSPVLRGIGVCVKCGKGTERFSINHTRPFLPIRSTSTIWYVRPYSEIEVPSISVAKHLYQMLPDNVDSCVEVEAYWLYTNTQPPYYTPKFEKEAIAMVDKYVKLFSKESNDMAEKILMQAWNVIGFGSAFSLFAKFGLWNILSMRPTKMAMYVAVLVDAMRHFVKVADSFSVKLPLGAHIVKKLAPLKEVSFESFVPTQLGIVSTIGETENFKIWVDGIAIAYPHSIRIHLFHLKKRILGGAMGILHAVVEIDGVYIELEAIQDLKVHINITKRFPIISEDRPLCKTLVIPLHERIKGFDSMGFKRMMDNSDYKFAGDNCLFFSNLICYSATGKIIPWENFGLYGFDFTVGIKKGFTEWFRGAIFSKAGTRTIDLDFKNPSVDIGFPNVSDWLERYRAQFFAPKSKKIKYHFDHIQLVHNWLNDNRIVFETGGVPSESKIILAATLAMEKYKIFPEILEKYLSLTRFKGLRIPMMEVDLVNQVIRVMRNIGSSKIGISLKNVIYEAGEIPDKVRIGKKVVWTPLVGLVFPRYMFWNHNELILRKKLKSNIRLEQSSYTRITSLPDIIAKYRQIMPNVDFPEFEIKHISDNEYQLGFRKEIRTDMPNIDSMTEALITALQSKFPHEIGIFSLRGATASMAERITDRYFTGVPEGKLSEEEKLELAEAIFNMEPHLFEKCELMDPEETWKKWNLKYSAGFPYRFDQTKGNRPRSSLVAACGGKEGFLEAVKRYIQDPEKFATVSHSFIKDEVLPKSKIEIGKIRTIIAQDPLSYFTQMLVDGDQNKRMDPNSSSVVGISAQHGELAQLGAKHLKFKYHYSMDVTAFDSRLSRDFFDVIKIVRKLGYKDHPQKEKIEKLIDVSHENLFCSWIVDIHTGRARLKSQGATTGHASTTPSNAIYIRALFLKGWKEATGLPYSAFHESCLLSSYSDDNIFSTNLGLSQFSGQLLADYLSEYGVDMRVEQQKDTLDGIEFLAKEFSLKQEDLDEVERFTGLKLSVAVKHNRDRLLLKFDDMKKKNKMTYRWDRAISFLDNCAHHPEIHAMVTEYIGKLQVLMNRRDSLRRYAVSRRPHSYEEVMKLTYQPTKTTHLLLHEKPNTILEKLTDWFESFKIDLFTLDAEINIVGRTTRNLQSLFFIGGLRPEKLGISIDNPKSLYDENLTLEHHIYLVNGCPDNEVYYRNLCRKSPFNEFLRPGAFWLRKSNFSMSDQMRKTLVSRVGLIMACYVLVCIMEKMLYQIPVIGAAYKLVTGLQEVSADMYSKLSTLFYVLYGDSSAMLSAMISKDRYSHLKHLTLLWFSGVVSQLELPGVNPDPYRELVESIVQFTAHCDSLFLYGNIELLLPSVNKMKEATGKPTGWDPIDHSVEAQRTVELLAIGKIPIITAPTGAGKSTDFIMNLKKHYETIFLSVPRRIMAMNNPIAQTRLYSGSDDVPLRGAVNVGTNGFFVQALSTANFGEDSLLILDEFHELDEDALILLERFNGSVITISATPEFPSSSKFTEIRLVQSRVSKFTVTETYEEEKGEFKDRVMQIISDNLDERILVIHPQKKIGKDLLEACLIFHPDKSAQVITREKPQVYPADFYFATSIADAGITIPGVTLVIDSGKSLGRKGGEMFFGPSSHNTSDQRRGRTGRTCNGRYLRLSKVYDDVPLDASVTFTVNHPTACQETGRRFANVIPRGFTNCENLPWQLSNVPSQLGFDCFFYYLFLLERNLDEQYADEMYMRLKQFGVSRELPYLIPYHNTHLRDLQAIKILIDGYSFDDKGSNWVDPYRGVYAKIEFMSLSKYRQIGVKWNNGRFSYKITFDFTVEGDAKPKARRQNWLRGWTGTAGVRDTGQ